MALINWMLGVVFALLGLTFFDDAFFFSLFSFLIAAVLIPPIYQRLVTKLNIKIAPVLRYVIAFLLFAIAMQIYPQDKANQNSKAEINSEHQAKSIDQIKVTEVTAKVTPTNTPTPTLTPTPTPSPLPTRAPSPTITYPTWTPIPTQPAEQVQPNVVPQTNTSFSCNCSKTCDEMASCEEAYFQLNTCGCSRRDGDHDGIPCETICQ